MPVDEFCGDGNGADRGSYTVELKCTPIELGVPWAFAGCYITTASQNLRRVIYIWEQMTWSTAKAWWIARLESLKNNEAVLKISWHVQIENGELFMNSVMFILHWLVVLIKIIGIRCWSRYCSSHHLNAQTHCTLGSFCVQTKIENEEAWPLMDGLAEFIICLSCYEQRCRCKENESSPIRGYLSEAVTAIWYLQVFQRLLNCVGGSQVLCKDLLNWTDILTDALDSYLNNVSTLVHLLG